MDDFIDGVCKFMGTFWAVLVFALILFFILYVHDLHDTLSILFTLKKICIDLFCVLCWVIISLINMLIDLISSHHFVSGWVGLILFIIVSVVIKDEFEDGWFGSVLFLLFSPFIVAWDFIFGESDKGFVVRILSAFSILSLFVWILKRIFW